MRQLNEAEKFYLASNRSKDTKSLARALMTTENNIKTYLAQLPAEQVKEVQAEPPKPPAMAMEVMARNTKYGAIAMTEGGSQHADASDGVGPNNEGKSGVKKLPEGVGRFR